MTTLYGDIGLLLLVTAGGALAQVFAKLGSKSEKTIDWKPTRMFFILSLAAIFVLHANELAV